MTLDDLNALDRDRFISEIGWIYEHSPWVAERAWTDRPFPDVEAVHASHARQVSLASNDEKLALLRAHPDLGSRLKMTTASTDEQVSAGLDRLTSADFDRLTALNATYRSRFDFPFILAIKGATPAQLFEAFERRLHASRDEEFGEALHQVLRIARFRLEGMMDTPKRQESGHLSTHVLDTAAGIPAEGVAIDVHHLDGATRRHLVHTATNADGRTPSPLLGNDALETGIYELTFHVGDYFARRGVATTSQPFLGEVVVRFGVSDPHGRFHVPLLVSPYGYTTYRGS